MKLIGYGIKKVPIVDKMFPFYKAYFETNPKFEYLIPTEDDKHFQHRKYYGRYFHSLMEQLEIEHILYCCRHTHISILAKAYVIKPLSKKVMGHPSTMTLVEKAYSHSDVKELVNTLKNYIKKDTF